MSPVGSYESLMAAIQGGAGSVYFGIEQLNMRAKSSNNFTLNDLVKISNICKENNIRSYITLNTIIYDDELPLMKSIVDAAKANDITAIIASDISVIQYANSVGMEVHISTQTNITNIEAVKYYSQFADVMVYARELNLEQVAAITKEIEERQIKGPSGKLVKIEVFVHGALCMAVSGKCYLSLDNFNYSANRGECLQPCRREYIVRDKDNEIELEIDNKYIMSPKDL
ncbi:MAG: U32 family peptidase, partial [Bacteroidales bacterium]|nr:U32 family peptidase [Bacteroidales bacterium]